MKLADKYRKQLENEKTHAIKHVTDLLNQEGKDAIDNRLVFTFSTAVDAVSEWYDNGSNPLIHRYLCFDNREEIERIVTQILLATYKSDGYIQLQALVGEVSVHYLDVFDKALLIGELVGILADEDVLDVTMAKQCFVELGMDLPKHLKIAMNKAMYLPPMLVQPETVEHNEHCGYLSVNQDIVLGREGHGLPQALDIINILNSVAFTLDVDALKLPEIDSMEFEEEQQIEQWEDFVETSREVYKMLYLNGNKFYFPHKFDKRGRVYTCGYHVNLQSMEYKRSMLEFHDKVIIEGE